MSVRSFFPLFLLTILAASFLVNAANATLPIDVKSEYTDGIYVMRNRYGWDDNYYAAWANDSGVEMLFLSDIQWVTVNWFGGLHFKTLNGSNIFVGNAFTGLEVFNDSNHNGIVDARQVGPTEVEYYLTNFTMHPVHYTLNRLQKSIADGITHYKWGIAYSGQIYGTPPDCSKGCYPSDFLYLNVTNLAFNYDFFVNTTQAHLKMNFQISPVGDYPKLAGRSIAAGYSTSLLVVSQTGNPGPCQPQNSTQAGNYTLCAGNKSSASGVLKQMTIQIGDGRVFAYQFGGNYTLTQAGTNSTYTSTASLIGPNDVGPSAYSLVADQSLLNMEYSARQYASMVIPNADQLNLTYSYATMVYRVSYPTWSAASIMHDPELVAYLVAKPGASPTNPPTQPPTNPPGGSAGIGELNLYLILVPVAGTFAVAVYLKRRRFKVGEL